MCVTRVFKHEYYGVPAGVEWELLEDGSAKAGGGAEVEDARMPAIGAKEEGTSATLSLVFL